MTAPNAANANAAHANAAHASAVATDEDAAAVLVILTALAATTTVQLEPVASRSVWGRRAAPSAPGQDAWWASGQPR